MKDRLLCCVRCAKPIEEAHRFRITEERLVMHVDCFQPSKNAHVVTGVSIKRGEFRVVLYPGKF